MISGEPSRTPLRRLTPSHYVEFSRLGEGSMGLVYLALDTELNRRVAFKMIRPLEEEEGAEPLEATPSPEDETFGELKARFLQEAWVTGGLEHPGIVPVYELGETTGGIPYYTMRVVRGERTLTDAIEQAQGLDGRLALLEPFLKVCDTVRYAHARGVIHRDLKPSNIALGDYGEAVVLDWGLAKLKDRPDLARSVWQKRIEELRDETDLHTLASAIGTPGYMSPEAALVEIDKVDARSDVYSLGAILYRILTGKLPYEFQSYPELVQKLTGEVPRDPSEVDAAVPASLSRICLKALSAKREERYTDADEVAAAIRAWQRESALEREVASLLREAGSALETAPSLGGEALLRQVDRVTAVCARVLELRPGEARAEALQAKGHQLRERAIVEREQGARKRLLKRVAVIGLAVATAATVLVALLLDAKRREAEEARTREAQARTRAEQERARAEDLSSFMLFDLREGLEPIGRLDLLDKVARKAMDYCQSLPADGLTPAALKTRLTAFGNVAEVLKAQGDLDAALESYQEALAIARRLVHREPSNWNWQRDLSNGLNECGRLMEAQGNLAGALVHYRESLAITGRKTELDPTNAEWQRGHAISLERVGDVLRARGDLAGALQNHSRMLVIRRRLAEQDPTNAQLMHGLSVSLEKVGFIRQAQGDLDAALQNFQESLAIARRRAEQDPADMQRQLSLSFGLHTVGRVVEQQRDLDAALSNHGEALAIRRRLAEHDTTNATWQHNLAASLNEVGRVLEAQGDLEKTLEAYGESLTIDRRLAKQNPSNLRWQHGLSVSLDNMGWALRMSGRLEEAVRSFREEVTIRRRLSKGNPTTARWTRDLSAALRHLGLALEEQGTMKEAARVLREALEVHGHAVESAPHLAREHGQWVDAFRRVALLTGERPVESAMDHLLLARALFDKKEYPDATRHYAAAFEDESIRTKPNSLYDGACAAALASAALEGTEAAQSKTRALEWLAADLQHCREALAQAEKELAGDAEPEQHARWEKQRQSLIAHVEHARTKDPDLASLRGTPAFEKLFEETDDER